jgi:hypothetical protein
VSAVFEALTAFLDVQKWSYTVMDGEEALHMRFLGQRDSFAFFAQAMTDRPVLLCYSVRDDRVPADRRVPTAELLTRLNYPLVVGSFEMDLEDGEVRFRSSIDFEGAEPTEALIRNVVFPNVRTMELCLPAIQAVADEGAAPEAAAAAAAAAGQG